MAPLFFYLALFAFALCAAVWTAFGPSLDESFEFPNDSEPLPGRGGETLIAFLTGFGGAGALLTHEGRLTVGLRFGFAAATGCLVAALVLVIVNGFLLNQDDEPSKKNSQPL
ncbi:MAG TPA: hypothetical protein VGR00_08880 [Thermoanaerobaculia bacterium]|nr:hypothetical protein [Thermoanaerobaculia bacterium]